VNQKTLVSTTILLVSALSACSTSGADDPASGEPGVVVPVDGGGTYVDILPNELQEMLSSPNILLVNVHVPNEGEIPGTDLHIPFDEIGQRTSELSTSKEDTIVVYCRSGSMSAIASRELVELGYSAVFNLDGGYRAWIQAGYEFDG
jgi:rhodanese-related sulfurtransferase